MKITSRIVLYEGQDIASLPKSNVWVRIVGQLPDEEVNAICDYYGIHALTAADILNYDHQPKFEVNDYYSQFLMKLFSVTESERTINQFSMIVSNSFVITFEQVNFSYIGSYFQKLLRSKSRPMHRKIAFDILSAITDSYLDSAYYYQDKLDETVEEMIDTNYDYDLNKLFDLKREIHLYRRTVRPSYKMIEEFSKPSNYSYTSEFSFYIKNLLDHASKAVIIADNMWETANNVQNEMLTQLQYKLSKTMNVMTAVSVIFSPLVLIVGIYGMNFKHMPELELRYGYPLVLVSMLLIGLVLMFVFIRRRLF